MKVLVVGGGGREHALCWALRRSRKVDVLRCAPGNAGIAADAELVDLGAGDVEGLERHAVEQRYDLVVVGPEAPLVEGLADRLQERGIPAFGASASAARLEGSKAFAKEFMARHQIPTARFRVLDDPAEAESYLRSSEVSYPLVVKADGLAAGKGVLILDSPDAAFQEAGRMLRGESFGDAGRRVVVEECLVGREASFFVLCDGERFVDLATCQDYKRAGDGDTGLNTGGMGTYSPSVYLDDGLRTEILDRIVRPTVAGMAADGQPYRGILYVGLMLTEEGPKVLEYNCRFGDPEAQVLLPRLDGDWVDWFVACARGELGDARPAWLPGAAVCVVMTSGGYPGAYGKGAPIDGLEQAAATGAVVFHAGTSRDSEGRIVTAGGRVLGVTALGGDLVEARKHAYDAVGKIRWRDERHRSDIALDAVEKKETSV